MPVGHAGRLVKSEHCTICVPHVKVPVSPPPHDSQLFAQGEALQQTPLMASKPDGHGFAWLPTLRQSVVAPSVAATCSRKVSPPACAALAQAAATSSTIARAAVILSFGNRAIS